MRKVKTKKELIKAIQDGEKHIKIESLDLYAACKLAEAFNSVSALFKQYVITSILKVAGPYKCVEISEGAVVTITISILISAVAIIGILKNKKVNIKCKTTKEGGVVGEIEIG